MQSELEGKKDLIKKGRLNYKDDTLSSFINSAMNIEYVYLILLGISNFMESTSYHLTQDDLLTTEMTDNGLGP